MLRQSQRITDISVSLQVGRQKVTEPKARDFSKGWKQSNKLRQSEKFALTKIQGLKAICVRGGRFGVRVALYWVFSFYVLDFLWWCVKCEFSTPRYIALFSEKMRYS